MRALPGGLHHLRPAVLLTVLMMSAGEMLITGMFGGDLSLIPNMADIISVFYQNLVSSHSLR